MRVGELSLAELQSRLRGEGLCYRIGPFRYWLRNTTPALAQQLHRLYAHYELSSGDFADFHLTLAFEPRHLYRRAHYRFADLEPLESFPLSLALPYLEWCSNWYLYCRVRHLLMIHAGVVAHEKGVLLLPAAPGSGKSTLTAGLALRGWRLFSDEFALVRFDDRAVLPFPRPIALKNDAIDLVERQPGATLGPRFANTRKGTVAHLVPPRQSVENDHLPGQARLIVFPQYRKGATLKLTPLPRGLAFMKLPLNSFNYERLGRRGFNALADLVDSCETYHLEYGGDLAEVVAALTELMTAASRRLSASPPPSSALDPATALPDLLVSAGAAQATEPDRCRS